MTRKHTSRNRKSLRRRARGGGWSELPKGPFNEIAVNPGNQVHFPFTGPGKDCTGNQHSIRSGWIYDYSSKGLPGLSGGSRRNKNRKTRGGSAMPSPATTRFDSELPGPVTNPNLPPVSGSVTPKPGDFPDTQGVTAAKPDVVMSMPGVPTPGAAQMTVVPIDKLADAATPSQQKGGRYGFFPGMGPLNPLNGIGTSPAPFGRIPCEVGTYNPLNPNPGNIQLMSTAPLTPPFVSGKLAGGGTSYAASSANFPVVQVGQADSMRYNAPTAGYRNDFMTFPAPSPVPGLTIQTPYDAKTFNQACIKTGGSRKKYRRGGAMPVALNAGKFTPVQMDEIWTRRDFDGTNGLLPVKFGGRRTRRRRVIKHRRTKK